MEVKVTIGTTPELTGLALALTSLINGEVNIKSKAIETLETIKGVVGSLSEEDEVIEDEKPAKEGKPKSTRSRSKKEVPTVQVPPEEEDSDLTDEEISKKAEVLIARGGPYSPAEIRIMNAEKDIRTEAQIEYAKSLAEAKPNTDDSKEATITIEDIRKVQRQISLGGGVVKMKEVLASFGAESASNLKESDYSAYYEKLKGLL